MNKCEYNVHDIKEEIDELIKKNKYFYFDKIKSKFFMLLMLSDGFKEKKEYQDLIDYIYKFDRDIWLLFFTSINSKIWFSIQSLLFWNTEINDSDYYGEYCLVKGKKYKGILAKCYYNGYIDLFERLLELILLGIKKGIVIYTTSALYYFSLTEYPSITKRILDAYNWPIEWLDNLGNRIKWFREILEENYKNENVLFYKRKIDNIISCKIDSILTYDNMEKENMTKVKNSSIQQKMKEYKNVIELLFEMINNSSSSNVDCLFIAFELIDKVLYYNIGTEIDDRFHRWLSKIIIYDSYCYEADEHFIQPYKTEDRFEGLLPLSIISNNIVLTDVIIDLIDKMSMSSMYFYNYFSKELKLFSDCYSNKKISIFAGIFNDSKNHYINHIDNYDSIFKDFNREIEAFKKQLK